MTDWKALGEKGEIRGLSAYGVKVAHEAQDRPTDWIRIYEGAGRWRLVRMAPQEGEKEVR